MSGRTFTYQGNFDDFVRFLLPDVEMSSRRKSVGIGDSMLREIEEFMNRFVVTAVNDDGDIIFDAAGSYTFQGDVIIGGELQSSNWVNDTAGWQLRSDGTFEFNSSGDVRGNLGVHGDMTMFTGGAMKTNASGQRAEISEATTSTSIVGGAANFSGVDLYTGDAAEVEPGLLGIANTAAGSSTVVLAAADMYGVGQRPYLYMGSNTAGTLDTRLNDPSRVYLTAGNTSVDINQTGIDIRVADGSFEIGVKNLPSGSYHDKIFLTEDLVTFTLNNAEQMRLNTTGLGIGTNNPTQALDVAGTATATALAVTGEFTLPTSDGSADQVLVTNGSGTVSWATQSTSSPGGSDGQVQYNNGGSFGGASQLTYNDSTGVVTPGGIDAFQATNTITSSSAKFKFGRSSSQHLAFHGGSFGNYISSISQTTNIKNMRIFVSHDDGATGTTYDFGTAGRGLGVGGVAEVGTGLDIYTGGATLRGDLRFNAFALISSDDNGSTTNIDHIWHDDSANAWNFCSDTTYKAAGNSTIIAGVVQTPLINGINSSNRDKLRVWSNSDYTIGMHSGFTFGHLNDFAMTFQMNNDSDRGFWWGDTGHSNAQGAMSLTTNGRLYVATSLSVGQGESGTAPSTEALYVNGTIRGTGQFRLDSPTDQQVVLHPTTTTNRPYIGVYHHNDSSYIRAGYMGYPEHNASGAHMQMVADRGWVNLWAGGYGAGLRVGLPTGSYGTVETSGSGRNGWEGYSINGWVVFMANSSTGNFGIYDDVNNKWSIYCDFNSFVDLRHNGSWKARTASDGFEVAGHLYPNADNSRQLGKYQRAWDRFYLHQGNTFTSGGYWTLRSRDDDRQVMELVSSERFKKDIVDMPLEEAYQVLDARVIKYRGIDDDDDAPLEAGLSAESLHDAGYEYAVRYDEGHWGETPRSIYYEYLTVPLIKICQDQKNRIESLETRLAALEA